MDSSFGSSSTTIYGYISSGKERRGLEISISDTGDFSCIGSSNFLKPAGQSSEIDSVNFSSLVILVMDFLKTRIGLDTTIGFFGQAI